MLAACAARKGVSGTPDLRFGDISDCFSKASLKDEVRSLQSDTQSRSEPAARVDPLRGPAPVGDVLFQMAGGIRSGMGYCGVATIEELRCSTEFMQITSAGLRESHPHDVVLTREAPNYSL